MGASKLSTFEAWDEGLEDLDAVVLAVADQDLPVTHNGDALQALELSRARTPATERAQERSVGMEDLDAVVAGVADEDVALVVNGDAPAAEHKNESLRWQQRVE